MSGARLHTLLPELTSRQPVMVIGAAVIDVIADAYDPALKAELDAVNQLDFNRYATALAKYRQQREAI